MADSREAPALADSTEGTALRYLGPESDPVTIARHPTAARRIAEEHAHVVTRLIDRLASAWPGAVNVEELAAEGRVALRHAALTIDGDQEFGEHAVDVVDRRLRQVLAATEWFRQAMIGRARPLTETWRGLLMGGRRPTDEVLGRRLHLAPAGLADRFLEFATVFAIEPGALLPAGIDAKYAVADIVGGLPSEQQLTIALYFHQELTFAEMARVMGMEPAHAQESFGRAAAGITAEAGLATWRTPQHLTA